MPVSELWKVVLGPSTFLGPAQSTGAIYGVSDPVTLLNTAAVIICLYGGLERFMARQHCGIDPGVGECVSISTLAVLLQCVWFGVEQDHAAWVYAQEKYEFLAESCIPMSNQEHYLPGHAIRRLRIGVIFGNAMQVPLGGFTLLYAFDGKGVSAKDFIDFLESGNATYEAKYHYLRHMLLNASLEVACITSLTPRLWRSFSKRSDWFQDSISDARRRCYKNTFACPLGRLWCVKVLHSQGFGHCHTMMNIWYRPDAVIKTYPPARPELQFLDVRVNQQYATLRELEGGVIFTDLSVEADASLSNGAGEGGSGSK